MTGAAIRIASRGSPLALAQARIAQAALGQAGEIVSIRTSGDRIQDRKLAEAGGKGLFTKEIEEALIDSRADIAVHSMKDVPTALPPGLEIAAVLPREDARDVFIARDGAPFASLKKGARIGTSAVRREAQIKRARPDVETVLLRGNVGTRLAKLEAGDYDAIILAKAGLDRLGLAPRGEILDGPDWLPALCQGAIGIEVMSANAPVRDLVRAVDHRETSIAIECERAFLAALDGSCRTPIAGYARIENNKLAFNGEVLTPDGQEYWSIAREAPADCDAAALGRSAAADIRDIAGDAWVV